MIKYLITLLCFCVLSISPVLAEEIGVYRFPPNTPSDSFTMQSKDNLAVRLYDEIGAGNSWKLENSNYKINKRSVEPIPTKPYPGQKILYSHEFEKLEPGEYTFVFRYTNKKSAIIDVYKIRLTVK